MAELHYRVRGEGEPVLLIHGLFGSLDNLGMLARQLDADYKVISIDQRCHGRSPHTHTISYPEMAADALAVLDKEGIESTHVIGHSMGGKTAMQMALTASERINKLVVLDIAPVTYSRHHDRILEGMQKVADAAPDSRAGAEEVLQDYEEEAAVLSFLLTNWRRQEDGGWGWRLGLSTILKDYDNIIAGNTGTPFDKDTLFIRGGLSNYVTADHRDDILGLFPRAGVRTIESTGHWLHAEKPDMVGRAIKRFIENK